MRPGYPPPSCRCSWWWCCCCRCRCSLQPHSPYWRRCLCWRRPPCRPPPQPPCRPACSSREAGAGLWWSPLPLEPQAPQEQQELQELAHAPWPPSSPWLLRPARWSSTGPAPAARRAGCSASAVAAWSRRPPHHDSRRSSGTPRPQSRTAGAVRAPLASAGCWSSCSRSGAQSQRRGAGPPGSASSCPARSCTATRQSCS
mmetsp:Transcript_10712/g.30355  ORF Transcript_10712/g.30355 Transcript_10712/m.30355 type:complete len:200 (+) Transcript_10712:376-975(+)